ncbi:hypothetical protein BOTBODRAFT_151769 [Botryobasidium botryosum FD-172 SS1]|uniref:Acyl-CoA thioesterase-like N-terminal HotDog domain-containing protein n=1 Tax=Botryobasidium botryosum (strain FD-172 SS1) TaxID=930990 RepID=A0A067MZ29_BOTB1|nr:hypothetical protein BOTBODRAFT_151769 [Botryobasidium botryosum FD-172 SS1]
MPLNQAIAVTHVSTLSTGTDAYIAVIDPGWTNFGVPHGGYMISLLLKACIHRQSKTRSPDCAHLAANFIRVSKLTEVNIEVKVVNEGKNFTYLDAVAKQDGNINISATFVFTNLPSIDSEIPARGFTLSPPHPQARRIPLPTHPSEARITPTDAAFNFSDHMKWAEDQVIQKRNEASWTKGNSSPIEVEPQRPGLEWGAWYELTDKEDIIDPAKLVVFADTFMDSPALLAPPNSISRRNGWFPTLGISMDFYFKLGDAFSSPTPLFAPRTVGLYSFGKFIVEGRHDQSVEVWTAPASIGSEGLIDKDWRSKAKILAVSTQAGLTIPLPDRNGSPSSKL